MHWCIHFSRRRRAEPTSPWRILRMARPRSCRRAHAVRCPCDLCSCCSCRAMAAHQETTIAVVEDVSTNLELQFGLLKLAMDTTGLALNFEPRAVMLDVIFSAAFGLVTSQVGVCLERCGPARRWQPRLVVVRTSRPGTVHACARSPARPSRCTPTQFGVLHVGRREHHRHVRRPAQSRSAELPIHPMPVLLGLPGA